MTIINRKAEEKITVDNLKIDSFYANSKSLFYVYRAYIDNICTAGNERFFFNRIATEQQYGYTSMYKSKEELVRQLNSFSFKPIEVEINEV